jgi:hypothetical protein
MLKYILGGLVLRAPDAQDGGSPSPSDVTGADSSQQEQAEQEQTQAEGDTEAEADGAETATETDGEEQVGDQQDSQQEQQQEETQAAENVTLDKPEDKDLPFHKHARFQEVIRQKAEAVQEVEKIKPLAQQATALNDFMRQNNISQQEFQSALQYLQALRSDPVAAFKMLEPTYKHLAQFAGEVIPDDLQAQVAAGTLPLDAARELTRARAQQQYQTVRQQWQQQGGQQATQSIVQQSIGLWQTTKMQADPDLKPGSDLYKLVDNNLKAMPVFQTAEQAMAGCEQAYKDAKAFFAKYALRQAAQRKVPLQSRHSASGNNHVVKTAEEVARFIGSGGKPHQLRYS